MPTKIQNITNKQAKNKVLSLFLCLLLTPGATFAQQDKKMVHPTFRVIRQSCRAYNLSLK